ncbi:hypothetical protein C0995_014537, partial [Termitomyces sp. Mi166
MESYKDKEKSKALVAESERTGTKRAFKSKETVESNSNKEEEERVCVIKKIKCKHVKELTGAQKEKRVPVAEPSHPTLKLVILVSGASKFVLKMPVAPKMPVSPKAPVAGLLATPLQTATSVPASVPPISAPKIVAPAPAPAALTAKPVKKGTSVGKDPFIKSSRVIDAETQETLRSDDNTGNEDNEDGKSEDDGGEDDGDGVDDEDGGSMDVNASGLVVDASFLKLLHLEEALQRASKEAVKIIEDVEPAPM